MNNMMVTGMILIAICCIMLATQPDRGMGHRRSRRERPPARKDDPAPRHALPASRRQPALPTRSFHNLTHRNHWPRPDLDRTFGQASDALPPELSVWPIHSPWLR